MENCLSKAVTLRIEELLKLNNMKLSELERKMAISYETLKSIRKGKIKGVNLKTVVLVAEGFGITVSEFLNSDLFKYDNLELD